MPPAPPPPPPASDHLPVADIIEAVIVWARETPPGGKPIDLGLSFDGGERRVLSPASSPLMASPALVEDPEEARTKGGQDTPNVSHADVKASFASEDKARSRAHEASAHHEFEGVRGFTVVRRVQEASGVQITRANLVCLVCVIIKYKRIYVQPERAITLLLINRLRGGCGPAELYRHANIRR